MQLVDDDDEAGDDDSPIVGMRPPTQRAPGLPMTTAADYNQFVAAVSTTLPVVVLTDLQKEEKYGLEEGKVSNHATEAAYVWYLHDLMSPLPLLVSSLT